MQFEVLPSLLGGTCIGLSALWNFVLNGRVTGVSGELSKSISTHSKDSLLFLLGLLASGKLISHSSANPVPVDVLAIMHPARLAIGTFILGTGASLGNGCTSGHGVCGLARLSRRSLVAVVTFMSTGAATASMLNSSIGIPESPLLDLQSGTPWLFIALLAISPPVLGAIGRGALFGTGLALSRMMHPAKTLGFLDLRATNWDASMIGVFAGALPLSFVGARFLAAGNKPIFEDKHSLPTNTRVDRRLVLGAALFGVGWGIAGICPGPGFTYLGARLGSRAAWIAIGALSAGVVCGKRLGRMMSNTSS